MLNRTLKGGIPKGGFRARCSNPVEVGALF